MQFGFHPSRKGARGLKCDELEKLPGVMADIYKGTVWDGSEWYVKFFRRDDGSTVVDVWSLKEDGWM